MGHIAVIQFASVNGGLMAEGCRKPTARTPALQVRGTPLRRWGPRNSRAPTDCFLAVLRTTTPGHQPSLVTGGFLASHLATPEAGGD